MSVLGAMLLHPPASEAVLALIDESDFYLPSHREIFKAIAALAVAQKAIDSTTVRNELASRGVLETIGGEYYLIQLMNYVPVPANGDFYAQIVQDQATLRRLQAAAQDIVKLVHSPTEETVEERLSESERRIFEIGQRRLGSYFIPVKTLTSQFFTDLDHMLETREANVGVESGFIDLDKLLTGLYPGELIIIAARPSMGKTSFALDIARKVAAQEKGAVAFFSLEMGALQLVKRLISMESSVSSYDLKDPDGAYKNYEAVLKGVNRIYDLPIMIDESSEINPLEMRGKCRRLKAEMGLSLVVVDYIQLMKGSSRKTENRVQELSEIARSLKAMAKELKVPVVALGQLNRAVEGRDDKRPQLSDIRDSGSIEAEADVVMLLYRDMYYKMRTEGHKYERSPEDIEVAEIIVSKHRNGDVGTVYLGFQPSFVRYLNIDEESKKRYLQDLKEDNFQKANTGKFNNKFGDGN